MKKPVSKSVSAVVLQKAKSGKIQMKPRFYYVLIGTIGALVVFLASTTIAYLANIMFFWVRVQTANTAAYGARAKLAQTIASFPWWSLLALVALLVLAVVIIRHQGHMYRLKISTTVLIILLSSLIVGLLFSLLSFPKHEPGQFGAPRSYHQQLFSQHR